MVTKLHNDYDDDDNGCLNRSQLGVLPLNIRSVVSRSEAAENCSDFLNVYLSTRNVPKILRSGIINKIITIKIAKSKLYGYS
jgi:hypothetical protein